MGCCEVSNIIPLHQKNDRLLYLDIFCHLFRDITKSVLDFAIEILYIAALITKVALKSLFAKRLVDIFFKQRDQIFISMTEPPLCFFQVEMEILFDHATALI